ncbi:hypothetical protein D3C83_175630 [compost metagenome]
MPREKLEKLAQLYADLERDIRHGSRTVPDFDRAVRLTQLLDAIEASSAEGRTLAVGDS